MHIKYPRVLTVLMAFAIIVTACNLPGRSEPEAPQGDQIATSAALTVEARMTARPPSVTQPAPEPTNTQPPPLATPTRTTVPTNTTVPSPTTTEAPCDRAVFVTDVTIPDGTDFAPGDTFTKTWRVRNTGSCVWTSGYSLVFDQGDAMGGPASVQLTSGVVNTGETVDVSVNLTAPSSAGTYRGNWKLRNSSGVVFGTGASGTGSIFVEIDVVEAVAFSLSFEGVGLCLANYATVKIVNTGTEYLRSAQMKVTDLTASSTLYGPASNTKAFLEAKTDCPPGNNDADPGRTYWIAVSIGSPPSGNNARFEVKACTGESVDGDCVTKTVDFTIP